MSYSVVFSSRTGNTKLLAEEIRKTLGEEDCVYFGIASDEALNADEIYVGFWTDKGTCDESVSEFLGKIKDKKVFIFGTAGFGGNPGYFKKILTSVEDNLDDSVKLKGGFMCQGKMPMSVRDRYVKMMEDPDHKGNLKALIENFDLALSHPDEKDLSNLREEILK